MLFMTLLLELASHRRSFWTLWWVICPLPRLIDISEVEGPIRRLDRGSEWEPIKILLQRDKLDYVLKTQTRVPTRTCQGHVVTTDLPTLGTSPQPIQSRSTTQEAKDLSNLRSPRRTVLIVRVESPRRPGRRSTCAGRTVCKSNPNLQ
jgi:hypothetical protein